ncbi:MAG: hypothetical protein HY934_09815 [Candidatus Firestonebacteria bacterium]|nr:hypothetical protein [Candidatus Firestonebacteria bacterium]
MNLLERISAISFGCLAFILILLFYVHYKNISPKDSAPNYNISHKKKIDNNSEDDFINAKKHLDEARKLKEKDDYIKSVEEYRNAAKLHSGYMDASSKDFLGEELKNIIKLAIVKLNQKLRQNPQDKDTIAILKTVYKMERNFGRGCE